MPLGGRLELFDGRSPFFAAGFGPGKQGDKSIIARAERHVWPVLLAWTHFGEYGEARDSAGWLSCAKTTQSKHLPGGASVLDPYYVASETSWAFFGWLFVTGLMYF